MNSYIPLEQLQYAKSLFPSPLALLYTQQIVIEYVLPVKCYVDKSHVKEIPGQVRTSCYTFSMPYVFLGSPDHNEIEMMHYVIYC